MARSIAIHPLSLNFWQLTPRVAWGVITQICQAILTVRW